MREGRKGKEGNARGRNEAINKEACYLLLALNFYKFVPISQVGLILAAYKNCLENL